MAGGAPGPDEPHLEQARATLGRGCRLLDDARTREVLERISRTSSAEERVRSALQRAHLRLRRFDFAQVQQLLDEARAAAGALPPSAEGRALAAEVGLREAEVALVAGDVAAQMRGMSLALAIDPALKLDPAREPPTLVQLLEHVRAERGSRARLNVRVETTPPGARLFVAGEWRGETPLMVDLVQGPHVLWLSRDGYRARAERVVASAGVAVEVALEPIGEVERLRPLVDAVRQSDGERRGQAALALAAALGVDSVAVLDAGADAPALYTRPPPVVPRGAELRRAEAPRPRPWYRRGWVWGTIAGAAVVIGVVAGVAGYYGTPEQVSATCCR
ncbi:MAG TPA: PEGA domain-containing protein [Kofleriaceae bacterium]|nr:PEGA domain-containing protein [Kofleriaceae bacterium]